MGFLYKSSTTPLIGEPTPVFIDDRYNSPPSPGFRTCEGDQYELSFIGDVVVGAVAIQRVPVAAPAVPRVAFGRLRIPLPSMGLMDVALVWIDDQGNGWLVEYLRFLELTNFSYDTTKPPAYREMPYYNGSYLPPNITNNNLYPPNLIPALVAPFNPDGSLNGTITIDPTNYTQFKQGGELDFVVVDTAPGATDLAISLQF